MSKEPTVTISRFEWRLTMIILYLFIGATFLGLYATVKIGETAEQCMRGLL